MTLSQLQKTIERHFAAGPAAIGDQSALAAFLALRAALESGEARAASPDPASATGWRVNAWVKQGILLGFRLGVLEELQAGELSFVDKHTYPVRHFGAGDGIRQWTVCLWQWGHLSAGSGSGAFSASSICANEGVTRSPQ